MLGAVHEFSILPPADAEDNAGQIQLTSPAGSVCVEIKAATTGEARMSVTQVGRAAMNKDHYFLQELRQTVAKPQKRMPEAAQLLQLLDGLNGYARQLDVRLLVRVLPGQGP